MAYEETSLRFVYTKQKWTFLSLLLLHVNIKGHFHIYGFMENPI